MRSYSSSCIDVLARGGNTTDKFTLLDLNCYKDGALHCIV